MKSLHILLLLLLSGAVAPNSFAETKTSALSEKDIPQSYRTGVVRKLSLQEALKLAITQNLDIAIAEENTEISTFQLKSAKGDFEPLLSANYNRSQGTRPPFNTNEGPLGSSIENIDDIWNLSISKRFQTATQLTLSAGITRNESNSQNSIGVANDNSTNNLVFGSSLFAEIRQPLLRGFSFDLDVPRAQILRAEFTSDNAALEQKSSLMRITVETIRAYWDLFEQISAYKVQKTSLELALKQDQVTKKQIDAGLRAPSDALGSQSVVSSRQLALVSAEAAIQTSANELRRILNLPLDQWKRPLVTSDVPDFTDDTASKKELKENALANRPEIAQFKNRAASNQLDLRLVKNERLPTVDLQANLGTNGLDPSFGTSFSQAADANTRRWGVGVVLSWAPLGQKARADIQVTKRNQANLKRETERFLVTLHQEVESASIQLSAAGKSVVAAKAFLDIAEKSLNAEERKFVNGTSSNFVVGQRQEELAGARQAYLRALVGYQNAKANAERTEGLVLERNNIVTTIKKSAEQSSHL